MKRLYNKYINQAPIKEKRILNPQFLPLDILLVCLATILFIIFVFTPALNETAGRVILGFLFLLLPGYSFTAALFPRKDDLSGIERVALSFCLSIAITPLIGLLLNYTPFGIRLTPILISLSLFTILMNSIAYIRRLKLSSNERFIIKYQFNTEGIKRGQKIDKFLAIMLILSIILAVSMTVYAIAMPKQGEKFTEFYILGSGDKASNYPTNLTAGEKGNVLIGIINHENTKIDYLMVVQLNGKTIKNENITLSNNEKWENKFVFNDSNKRKHQKLEFMLYKLPDNTNVYRYLQLWVNIN